VTRLRGLGIHTPAAPDRSNQGFPHCKRSSFSHDISCSEVRFAGSFFNVSKAPPPPLQLLQAKVEKRFSQATFFPKLIYLVQNDGHCLVYT